MSDSLNAEKSQIAIKYDVTLEPLKNNGRFSLLVSKLINEEKGTSLFKIVKEEYSGKLAIERVSFIISEGESTIEGCIIEGSSGKLELRDCTLEREKISDEKNKKLLSYCLIKHDGELVITRCSFLNLDTVQGLITCKEASIKECLIKDVSREQGNGAAIYSEEASLEIVDTEFSNCVCLNGNGGGIYALINNNFKFEIKNDVCCFLGCSAKTSEEQNMNERGRGGAIFLTFSSFTDDFGLKNLEFGCGSRKNTANSGSNLFILSNNVETFFSKSFLPFLDTYSFEENEFCFSFEDDVKNTYSFKSLLNEQFVLGPSKVFIDASKGSDDNDCLSDEKSCQTFEKCFEKIKIGRKNVFVIGICYLESDPGFDKGSYYLKNYSSNPIVVTGISTIDFYENTSFEGVSFSLRSLSSASSYPILFRCSAQSVVFKDDMFDSSDADNHFKSKSVIYCSSGGVCLNGCSFKRLDTSDSQSDYFSSIYWSGDSLNITDCTFDDIYFENGNGGAVTLDMQKSSRVFIEGKTKQTEFKNCHSNKGGAIYFKCSSIPSEICFSNILFGDSSCPNTASQGRNIFIESTLLYDFVYLKNFPVFNTDEEDNGFEGAFSTYGYLLDLAVLAKSFDVADVLYVGDDGEDKGSDGSNLCRKKENPCKTLDHIISSCYSGLKDIRILNTLSENDSIIFGHGVYQIEGDSSNNQFIPLSQCKVSIDSDTSFSNLSVIFSTEYFSYGYKSFIGLESGALSFYNVFLTQSDSTTTWSYNLVELKGGDMFINNCSFTNFIYSGKKITVISGEISTFILNNTKFNGCSTNQGYGGALYLSLDESSVLKIGSEGSDTSFSNCYALRGGGIYLSFDSVECSVLLTDLSFGKDGKNEAAEMGENMLVIADDLGTVVNSDTFPFLVDVEEDNKYMGIYSKKEELTCSLIDVVNNLNVVSSDAFIGDKGVNYSSCLTAKSLCNSFGLGLKSSKFGSVNVKIIDTLSSNEEIVLKKSNCSFEGDSKNSVVNVLSKLHFIIYKDTEFNILIFSLSDILINTLLMLYKGTLALSSITFTHLTDSCSMVNPLIDITNSGNAYINSCTFSNFVVSQKDGSAIKAELKNDMLLQISKSQFINCEGYNSKGGCIYTQCESLGCVSLNGTSFLACSVEKGDGGALYVNIKEKGSFTTNLDGQTNTTFRKCSSDKLDGEGGRGGAIYLKFDDYPEIVTMNGLSFGKEEGDLNIGDEGYNVFIKANDLSKFITADSFPFLSGDDLAEEEALGEEKSEDGAYLLSVPLKYVVIGVPEVSYINIESKCIKKYCGPLSYPCKTLDDAFDRYFEKEKKVILDSEYTFDGDITMNSYSYTISKSEKEFFVTAGTDCSFIITVNSSFNTIPFILFSSHSKSIMDVTEGTLSLSSVSFYPLSGTCLFSSSLISITLNGSSVLSSCFVSNITANNRNGAVIYASLSSSSLSVISSSFTNCGVKSGNGGALYVDLSKKANLIIDGGNNKKAIFKGCFAYKEPNNLEKYNEDVSYGRGGAIYIKAGSNIGKIVMDNIQFGGDKEEEKNIADEGYDVFVEAKGLKNIINDDSFPFLEAVQADYEGAYGIEEGDEETINLVLLFITQTKKKSYWWVALIVVLFVLHVLIIVLIIILYVKKLRKKNDYKMSTDSAFQPLSSNINAKEMITERDNTSEVNAYTVGGVVFKNDF